MSNLADSGFLGNNSLREMDAAVQEAVERLVGQSYLEFDCAGALLFLPDPYSGLLEPAFDSNLREYSKLGGVSSSYSTLDNLRNQPNSEEECGIPTIAFQDGSAYSNDPSNDLRFGPTANRFRTACGIHGSMMAIRIDDSMGGKLGVIVTYTKGTLPRPTRDLERQRIGLLEKDLVSLATRLQQRRQALADNDLARFSELLRDGRTVRTGSQAVEFFCERLKTLLPAETILFRTVSPEIEAASYSRSVDAQQQSAITAFESYLLGQATQSKDAPRGALNRRGQDSELYDQLAIAFGTGRSVWCGVRVGGDSASTLCMASRTPRSISDHWTPNDLTLLMYACDFFRVQMSRSEQFDVFLKHLSEANGEEQTRSQLELFKYILGEMFGVDQILLARIARLPDSYEISADQPVGFSNNDMMCRNPKVLVPTADQPGPPDIMEKILGDYLRGDGQSIYVAAVGEEIADFALDNELVQTCDINGRLYFLACCAPHEKGVGQLKAILHMGKRDGSLQIAEETYPFLTNLGSHMANLLERQYSREVAKQIRQIRDIGEFTQESLQNICAMVATASRSLGCTLFLNVRCLKFLDTTFVEDATFVALLQKFCRTSASWEKWFGAKAEALFQMFGDFFGVTPDKAMQLLRSQDATYIGLIVAKSMYVRVVQSNSTSSIGSLADLVECHTELSDEVAARRFGEFVLENAYLPGFGLTGWVLRHRCPMLLTDKRAETLTTFHAESKQRGLASTPVVGDILQALRIIDKDIVSTLSTNPDQPPCHADHISEDKDRKDTQDTYLAHPLEDIDELGVPSGLLRISNSASLRQSFESLDKQVVESAAKHLSNLLGHELLHRESRVNEALFDKGSQYQSQHFFERLCKTIAGLNLEIVRIEEVLQQHAGRGNSGDTNDLRSIMSHLSELADTALGFFHQRVLALRILEHRSPWTVKSVGDCVSQWLTLVSLPAQVILLQEPAGGNLNVSTKEVIALCQLSEEIVKNYRRYEGESPTIALVMTDRGLVVYVGSSAAVVAVDGLKGWHSYMLLAANNSRGGGMRLVEKCAGVATVEFVRHKVTSGNRGKMVVRIRPVLPQKGGKA